MDAAPDLDLSLDYNEDQAAIHAAVDRFCVQQNVAQVARQSGQPFPHKLWRELAGLGVFYPTAPGYPDAGGALAVCAIAEALGRHVFPGPVTATYIAIQVVPPEAAQGLLDGRDLVSLSSTGSALLPFGPDANLFLASDGSYIAKARAPDDIEPVATLGGETWGRATLSADKTLPGAEHAFVIGNIATAAYLASAARQLLHDASAYAATRRQFGKTLGEFQAVSHPLADCAIGLTAAQTLARAAAANFDSIDAGVSQAAEVAAAALLSARRASLQTAFVCHQVFAGIGITLEGPAFHISRRIRQLASTPPVAGAREQELLLAQSGLGV
jgi:alkylation response protein AidB-like acyl-CoA dehydrogenase